MPKNPDIDAEALEVVLTGEAPRDYVKRVAEIKRDQPHTLPPDLTMPDPIIILAADTTVEVDGEILGKPANAQDASRMLKQLSGRSHWVHTAVAGALHQDDTTRIKRTILVSSEVEFAALSNDWIDAYIQTGEPMDKAGAYGIQGIAGSMIPRIRGSYTGIMGLPLYETQQLIWDLHRG